MKRTFLSKLHRNGSYYLVGAVLLLLGVPLYQFLLLTPQGFNDALAASNVGNFQFYLTWIREHSIQFLGYRFLLVLAFALLWSLPFTLFRIIVAQEVLGTVEAEEEEAQEDEEDQGDQGEEQEEASPVATPEKVSSAGGDVSEADEEASSDIQAQTGMPDFAWRGKGFAVIAAWSGLFGIALFALGTLASTIYLFAVSSTLAPHSVVPDSFAGFSGIFTVLTNTVGGGLLVVATLFFGVVIARRGRNLWPGIWIAFSYLALALAALFSGSAVAVASAPTQGQSPLTTPAILLFAIWVLWFGGMLVRLKPE